MARLQQIVGCLLMATLLVACGQDEGHVLKALESDSQTSSLTGFSLTPVDGASGEWTFTAQRKDGKECTGRIKKPTGGATDKYVISVNCPKVKAKIDPDLLQIDACKGGDKAACGETQKRAMELDEAHDAEKAQTMFSAACDGGIAKACEMSCLYAYGERPPLAKDPKKLVPRCSGACEAGSALSCERLGRYYESDVRDFVAALKAFDRACTELSHGESCLRYGWRIRVTSKTHASDPDKAMHYYQLGCRAGTGVACTHWGDMLAGSKRKAERRLAPRAYRKGCDLGEATSCQHAD